jgi:hypothetical protein
MAKKDGIQIERPETFLSRESAVQRAGTVILALFVLAGAAGAFGNGPLSRATTTAGNIELRYERFGRTTARTTIEVTVTTGAVDGEPVRFRLERVFVEHLDGLELRPEDVFKGFDDTHAIFEVPAVGGRGHVELHFEPRKPGLRQTSVVSDGTEPAYLRQFIYF